MYINNAQDPFLEYVGSKSTGWKAK